MPNIDLSRRAIWEEIECQGKPWFLHFVYDCGLALEIDSADAEDDKSKRRRSTRCTKRVCHRLAKNEMLGTIQSPCTITRLLSDDAYTRAAAMDTIPVFSVSAINF